MPSASIVSSAMRSMTSVSNEFGSSRGVRVDAFGAFSFSTVRISSCSTFSSSELSSNVSCRRFRPEDSALRGDNSPSKGAGRRNGGAGVSAELAGGISLSETGGLKGSVPGRCIYGGRVSRSISPPFFAASSRRGEALLSIEPAGLSEADASAPCAALAPVGKSSCVALSRPCSMTYRGGEWASTTRSSENYFVLAVDFEDHRGFLYADDQVRSVCNRKKLVILFSLRICVLPPHKNEGPWGKTLSLLSVRGDRNTFL